MVALMIGMIIGAIGCGNKSTTVLVIISPHWEGIQREFTRAFQEYYRERTGKVIELEWPDVGGTSQCLRYIRTRFRSTPKGIGADLFWGGGIDPYIQLKREGLLAKYKPPESVLKGIPKTIAGVPLYDRDYYWFGTALSGFGITFNKVVLNDQKLPRPKEWADLAAPVFYNWIELTDPRQSGSAHMMFEIILQAYGWERGFEVLTKMAGNARVFNRGSQEPIESVANGQTACAPTIDFYAWSKIGEVGKEIMGFVYPVKMTVINPDAIAMLKGAPHREIAEAFINFVLSPAGQRLWLLPRGAEGGPQEFALGRMSILPSLFNELEAKRIVTVNPFEWHATLKYDADKGSMRWELLNSLIGALFVDVHEQLRKAWKAVIDAGMPSTLVSQLIALPLDETQAMKWASRWSKDRAFAAEKEAEWATYAQRKYKQVLQAARRMRR
ncbi:MAG TPA: extracellular solute-binding protein [Armatimonadetes bacterium]|nr:extracellular solute-binding protein [Armatimonadota bacterium]